MGKAEAREPTLHDLEFLRSAWGLLPAAGDRDPGTATYMPSHPDRPGHRWSSCTCKASRRKSCGHRRRLETLVRELHDTGGLDPAARFTESFWHRLGESLLKGDGHTTIDHVRAVARPVLRHRILTNFNAEADRVTTDAIIEDLLERLPADGMSDGDRRQVDAVMR